MLKIISEFPEYSVSVNGEIYSHLTKKYLKPLIGTNGYFSIHLFKNKKSHTKMIHRIVANTFIENPEFKKEVNHKNGIKTDNRIDNLEWVTPKENIRHAIDKLGLVFASPNFAEKNGRSREVIDTKTGKIYACAKYAAIDIGVSESYLSQMLNGSHKNVTSILLTKFVKPGELEEINKVIKSVRK